MPLYYFNIHNDDVTFDDEGAELADEQAAHAHAIKAARSLAAETVMKGHFTGHHHIDVQDRDHRLVTTVRFDEAVEVRSRTEI